MSNENTRQTQLFLLPEMRTPLFGHTTCYIKLYNQINTEQHGGKFFVQIRPTFNNFLTFYPYNLKFETLLDAFEIQNLVVLVCQHFYFFGRKMTSQNGVKILNFYFRTFIWL